MCDRITILEQLFDVRYVKREREKMGRKNVERVIGVDRQRREGGPAKREMSWQLCMVSY